MSFLLFRKKPQKKLKIITKEKPSAPQKEKKQPKSKIEDLTHDERVALEVYEALKTKKNPQEDNDSDLDELEDDDVQAMDQDTEAVPDGEEERRAITYQIAKNKELQLCPSPSAACTRTTTWIRGFPSLSCLLEPPSTWMELPCSSPWPRFLSPR